MRPFGQRARPVDTAPLFHAPLFRPNGIQGRGCADSAHKISPMRSFAVLTRNDGRKMNDARRSRLGIDVSKATLDVDYASDQRKRTRKFANDPDGWRQMLAWLKAMDGKHAHICMEATGRHSLGLAQRCTTRATSSASSTRRRSAISPAPSSAATRPTRSMPP